jgi:hypothetical protein
MYVKEIIRALFGPGHGYRPWINSIKEGVHYHKYELGETPVSR